MELWDAYDINEKKLNTDLIRGNLIPKDIFHIVVEIICITPDNKILITKRDANKMFPLKWEITGGSALKGETPLTAAKRELEEETGVKADVSDLIHLQKFTEWPNIFHVYAVYKEIKDTDVILQEGETIDFDFVTLDSFIKMGNSEDIVYTIINRFNQYRDKLKIK